MGGMGRVVMKAIPTSHLDSINLVQSPAQLIRATVEAGGQLLGSYRLSESTLFFPQDAPARPRFWVITEANATTGRYFRPFSLDQSLEHWLAGEGAPEVFDRAPAACLCAETPPPVPLDARLQTSLAIRLPLQGSRPGLWLLGLEGGAPSLRDELTEQFQEIARRIATILPLLIEHERIAWENRQMTTCGEHMFKSLIAPDKHSMLDTVRMLLSHDLAFDRVLVAMVQPEQRTLRSELHAGFEASFVPFCLPLEGTDHPLVSAMKRGKVLLLDCAEATEESSWPVFGQPRRIDRSILMPLQIGTRCLGMIYADQFIHDGMPLLPRVLDLFARQAAAAIESLNLRIDAEHRASTDSLTGLYNRHFLDRMLQIEISRVRRYNQSLSILMIDLRDFKHINDAYGHQFGDYMLREAAQLILANVRRPDIVVRYGGDEFVVLMSNTNQGQAQSVRDRIEQAFIERNRLQEDERMAIDVSLGLRSANAENIDHLLFEADMAMYAHKALQIRHQLVEALLKGDPARIERVDRIVASLYNVLCKKLPDANRHGRRVAHLALLLARRIGISGEDLIILALGALLQDIGKASLPTELLRKTEAARSKDEIEAFRHHPALGDEFFEGVEYLEPVRPLIRSHHERFDGDTEHPDHPGFPDGLAGRQIPRLARLLHLATFAAGMLAGDHPGQPPASPEAISRKVAEASGKAFDPQLVDIFLAESGWSEHLGDIERIQALLGFDQSPRDRTE